MAIFALLLPLVYAFNARSTDRPGRKMGRKHESYHHHHHHHHRHPAQHHDCFFSYHSPHSPWSVLLVLVLFYATATPQQPITIYRCLPSPVSTTPSETGGCYGSGRVQWGLQKAPSGVPGTCLPLVASMPPTFNV
uniref:Putative secreted protein n=1 Tax=Anopheles marajoara TaxID=58244 RepID=A0A2M4C6M9_9DIPT